MVVKVSLANVLGNGAGVFRLLDSDRNPGSFFTAEDLCSLLGVEPQALNAIPSKYIDGLHVFNEKDIRKAWYGNEIDGATPHRIRNFKRSLDELIVSRLLELTYPEIEIEAQAKWGKKSLDLLVRHPLFGSKIVEFHGPQHFADMILKFSTRFNALRDSSVGYFYGPNTEGRANVEHPIISKISAGKVKEERLLPPGYQTRREWLPASLLKL